jgi:hypothetical protein
MTTAERLSEKSRQGFEVQKPSCIGLESDLSRNTHWGCGHVYDETPVDLVVYVRNDPVNNIDTDGRMWGPVSELQYLISMGWNTYDAANLLYSLPNIGGSNPYWGNMNPSYFLYMLAQDSFNAFQYQLYLLQQSGFSILSSSGSGSGFVTVSSVKTSGDQHKRVVDVLEYIKNNISSDCSKALPGVGGVLDTLLKGPSSIAVADYDLSIDAFVGGTNSNLPSGIAMAINSLGLFFYSSLTREEAGYMGGGVQAQLLILLHELGHLTLAFGANEHDAGDQAKVNANNDFIERNCGGMINAAPFIPFFP